MIKTDKKSYKLKEYLETWVSMIKENPIDKRTN